jgi:hypothetical protein
MQLPLLKSGSFFVPQVLNGHPQERRPLEVELAAIDGFLQHRKLKAESRSDFVLEPKQTLLVFDLA